MGKDAFKKVHALHTGIVGIHRKRLEVVYFLKHFFYQRCHTFGVSNNLSKLERVLNKSLE